ncbi:MAG: hypothetical protein AAGA90_15455 [Actinomycetota bacterium]
MPKGNAYPGSPDDLQRYAAIVDAHGHAELKGAKNPYTSRNGWMSSFLDPDGLICFRLDEREREDLIAAGGGAVEQYGKNMPDFASAPADMAETDLEHWFATSWDHTGSLDPK